MWGEIVCVGGGGVRPRWAQEDHSHAGGGGSFVDRRVLLPAMERNFEMGIGRTTSGTWTTSTEPTAGATGVAGRLRFAATPADATTSRIHAGYLTSGTELNLSDTSNGAFTHLFGFTTGASLGSSFVWAMLGAESSSAWPSPSSGAEGWGVFRESGTVWRWREGTSDAGSTGLSVTTDAVLRLSYLWNGTALSVTFENLTGGGSATKPFAVQPSSLLDFTIGVSRSGGDAITAALMRVEWVHEW